MFPLFQTLQMIAWFTSQASWTHLHPMGKGADWPVLICGNRHGQIFTVWFVDGMVSATWQDLPTSNYDPINVWDAR